MMKNWESHCHRCGLCCYEKIRQADGSWILDMSNPCPWLDENTMLCKVYKRRLIVYPRCRRITIWRALFARYLPPSCGYVRNLRPGFFPKSRLVILESLRHRADRR